MKTITVLMEVEVTDDRPDAMRLAEDIEQKLRTSQRNARVKVISEIR